MARKHIFVMAAAMAGLLVLSTASFASDEPNHSDTDTGPADTAEVHRDLAQKAVFDAALQAIESVKANNKLDLDIRLIGPTSVKIAGER